MKIIDNPFDEKLEGALTEVLQTLNELMEFNVNLPCSNCNNNEYSLLKKEEKEFACSYKCKKAANNSSISSRYPIESNILPLVFALNELNIFRTAWSCEGHADEQGEIIKQAQVWFYAMHETLPQLLATHLTMLKGIGELRCYWQVCISPVVGISDGRLYEVKPVNGCLDDVYLDIVTISEKLKDGLKTLILEAIESANISDKENRSQTFY